MAKKDNKQEKIAFLFILFPIVMLIFGYFIYPFIDLIENFLLIPLFLGLILLIFGFLLKDKTLSSYIKILGWIVFSFYWSTQVLPLYIEGDNDIFNGVVCAIGVFVLFYIAYHEWLSLKRDKDISCLNWIAGASAIAGIIYFGIEKSPVAVSLIEIVAKQSAFVLELMIGKSITVGNATIEGAPLLQNNSYVVTIIFACTAIQSFVIFVGMICTLPKIDIKRRIIALAVTIIPVYLLNLFRNALVAYLTYNNITDFNVAHNYIAKTGSLVALIILLLIVVKIIPEVLDEIFCLTDLHKRNGPLEKFFKKIWGKK